MLHNTHLGHSIMDATLMIYEIVVPDFKNAGCVALLPCRYDGNIENLLRVGVWRIIQDYTEVRFVRVLVSAGNQKR